MSGAITRPLRVLALSEKGVRVALDGSALEGAFWLPKAHVIWAKPPELGECTVATVPDWLAAKHRQFGGEVAESRRDHQRPLHQPSERTEPMADQRDMSGSLSKNLKKEKETHADYVGSIVISGRKFWLNGWIKDGQNGKFLSLSAKPADEANAKPKPKPVAVEDEIPF